MNHFKDSLARNLASEIGVAFLELAMILPIAITLLIGTIELTRYISTHEEMSFFTQVAAHKGFTDCINNIVLSDPAPDAVTACIDTNVGAPLRAIIAADFPGTTMVVSAYYYNPLSGAVELKGYRRITNALPACSDAFDNDGDFVFDFGSDPECRAALWDLEDPNDLRPSKFNEARITSDFLQIIQTTRTLVIAEAFTPTPALVPGLRALTSNNWDTNYAVSIF